LVHDGKCLLGIYQDKGKGEPDRNHITAASFLP
jgi:hypothetical protein